MTTITHSFRCEDIRFSYAVVEQCENIIPHVHDLWELILFKKGDASYVVDGKVYRLTKNCLIISRPWVQHSIIFHTPADYARYNICFNENLLTSDVCRKLPQNIDVINFDGNDPVCGLFRKLSYYSEHFQGDTTKALLTHLTEEILCNALIVSKELDTFDVSSVNPLINQALKYISDNITLPLCIDDIAAQLFITKSHLHHLFVKYLNTTPKKFIISKKLILAQRDLRSGSKPTEVCLKYGFADYSTFYRDYRQHCGHAPSQEINRKVFEDVES